MSRKKRLKNKLNFMLETAVFNRDVKMINKLIKRGANINHCYESSKVSVLYHTIFLSRDSKIIKLLIEKGANVNIKNEGNKATPLFVAAAIKNLEVIDLLIENGADVNAKDENGKTIMDLLDKEDNYEDVIDLLNKKEIKKMELSKFIKDACLVEFKENTIDTVSPGNFGYFLDDFEEAKRFKEDNLTLYPYTLVSGDYGSAYIIEGWHIVNRIAYCFGEVNVGEVSVKYWEEDEES